MTIGIGHRVAIGFAAIVLIAAASGGYQYRSLTRVAATAERAVREDIAIIRLYDTARIRIGDMRRLRNRAVLVHYLNKSGGTVESESQARDDWREARKTALESLNVLESAVRARIASGEKTKGGADWRVIADTIVKARDNREAVSRLTEQEFKYFDANDLSHQLEIDKEIDSLRAAAVITTSVADQLADQLSEGAEARIEATYADADDVALIALAALIVIALAVGFPIQRSISRPLNEFVRFAERIGAGDLTQTTVQTGSDEIGRLGKTLNAMVEGLRGLAQQVRTGAESIASAVAEMQASAQQQAASTTEQSSAIQEFASTLEEIGESGTQISERAKTVSTDSESASQTAGTGVEAVRDTSKAMDSIREQAEAVAEIMVRLTEKAQSVGEITATVDEIAEQSNLLALNAAIEAVSAGDAGTRFSVVAEEMRNLAERAREATRQIRGLLGDMQQAMNGAVMQTEEAVKRAQAGKRQSDAAEETIHNLTTAMEGSVTTFRQIVAGIGQQQIGLQQATESVQGVRESMDQVAAGTRGLDEAARSLEELTLGLRRSAERYRL
jgi:methyl-accepting chemotaxis protein